MVIGVLKYPGGHGDAELLRVLRQHFNMQVREVWHKEEQYTDIGALFIGGGFPCMQKHSVIECMDQSPALRHMTDFAERGGYIIGFGNGFGLLCEAGLLPGKLLQNSNGRYLCRQVYITPDNNNSVLTRGLGNDEVFRNPVATEYGRYTAREEVLVKMRQDGQILFRFCDHEGRITEAVNYTGSADNIAGICNRRKNIFGMISQPERAVAEFRKEADGRRILGTILDHMTG